MKLKTLFISGLIIFLIICLIPTAGFCRRGCCSHHGGVCGGSCCDGTPLSAKCGGGSSSSSYKRTYRTPTSSSLNRSDSSLNNKNRSPYNRPDSSLNISPSNRSGAKSDVTDIIILKNGEAVKTNGVWEEDGQVKCLRYGAVIGYPKEDVERVEFGQSK